MVADSELGVLRLSGDSPCLVAQRLPITLRARFPIISPQRLPCRSRRILTNTR